jgi:Dolichyl-phosphate-mannose-protein mannosyltransferase
MWRWYSDRPDPCSPGALSETGDTGRRITRVVLVIGVALLAALIFRHCEDRSELRTVALLAGLALGLRMVATAVIYHITSPVHPEGVWLSDEASYFLATESLMPWPWDKGLPAGLDHLGGNGYLGLTTTISLLVGRVDAEAFRMANATFGTIVVVLCFWLAQSFFGRRAGLAAGLVAAVWPDLVFWSATMLRDTLGSLVVVGTWWALVTATRERWLRTTCLVLFGLVLLATLREYLAVAVGLGVVAWLGYPFVRRQRPSVLAGAVLGVVALGAAIGIAESRRIDEATHQVFYRQTVTRMETLGRLYHDPPPADQPEQPVQLPFRPGAVIALPDPGTGWLLTGLVVDSAQPGLVNVGLSDDTSRSVPLADVVLLQDARIPPLELFTWVLPSLLSVVAGLPTTDEAPSLAWIGAALAWDGLVVVAAFGLLRSRLSLRNWLYPLCVVVGTVAALSAIPGAPGNAERHRATQTLPLLIVFASGILVASRARVTALAGRAVTSPTSMPTSASTAVASNSRSDR